ncbi:hypothetical protein B9Z44_09235 [Limnohabitans curvus]|uniref:Uncharacterized protein n=1 Tax=Limnohabitans curvus TaxID=323423 RepID=A0A315ER64_9BURK|nr:hypothetical protein B9Z44_09235 [Limnohabitans curvus]
MSADELQQLEQLIYANVYKALATYQQQQRLAVIQRQQDSTSTVKPQATKRKKQLASKVKRTPHVAAPKPLPQPKPQVTPQPSIPKSYNPIKAAKPLPAPTRAAIKQPPVNQGENARALGNVDQRGRAMLPKHQRDTPIWDLVNKQ